MFGRGGIALSLLLALPATAAQVSLQVDAIDGPQFRARTVRAAWQGDTLNATVGELSVSGKTWRKASLDCASFQTGATVQCKHGRIVLGQAIPFDFSYQPKHLELVLFPGSGETWRLESQQRNAQWQSRVLLDRAGVSRLAPWWPSGWPLPSAGRLSGGVSWVGNALPERVSGAVEVSELAFSDAAGLHAGDKIAAQLTLGAARQGRSWRWQGNLAWNAGEVFWQPFYLSGGGHNFSASGGLSGGDWRIDKGRLSLAGVGAAQFSASQTHGQWQDADVAAAKLNAGGLYRQIAQPLLQQGAFAKLQVQGEIDFALHLRHGATESADLGLYGVSIADQGGRFALQEVNASLPWNAREARQGHFQFAGGRWLQLPLGPAQLTVNSIGMRFAVPEVHVPVLGGKLNIAGFSAEPSSEGWRWQMSAGLTPVSMEALSAALGWPIMHGSLSGVIPQAHYARHILTVDGSLLIRAFDGTTVVQNLSLLDPMGLAPRLKADIEMRGLELDQLTRTFSFGNMQGRIDADVRGLELSAWQPVKFDARVYSSPGDYPRKISQRAVENISALGGAGASAAIQRSFLRFFKQFGYDRIALSCKLRNAVCVMDGVGASQGGYVIVKGGGIPAITVIGYNRSVGWDELVTRLKRITQGNVKPIVQ